MAKTIDYLESLTKDKNKMKKNLEQMGVAVDPTDTFTEMGDKILNIEIGTTPTGTIDITENGMTDVTKYANANVNVPDGAWNYFVEEYNLGNFGIEMRQCIKTVPLIRFNSSYRYLDNMFEDFTSLQSVPKLDTSNIIQMNRMFCNCSSLQTIPQFDTSKVLQVILMFYRCESLTDLPLLNFERVKCINSFLNQCYNLKNVKGFKDLGKNYSVGEAENHYDLTIDLQYSKLLTHESLMNIINNLYDIKTKGVKPQQLSLGTENLAKLTPEEIAIATNKGWNVS